eukprot:6203717-Pleurochrysis_carterae.AAC.1
MSICASRCPPAPLRCRPSNSRPRTAPGRHDVGSVRVLLVEVPGVKLRLGESLYLHKLFLCRSVPDPTRVCLAVERFEELPYAIGMPRSSKKRSSGGGRTYTSPSSPSNVPWK